MSIFAETMSKAIGDYRRILRRYLSPEQRINKLAELKLKDPGIYKSDILLYKTAHAIVDDIQNNIQVPDEGYYSYYGIIKFCQYLQEYLSHYELEGNIIIHKAQKASRALVQAIQLMALPNDELNATIAEQLKECNQVVVECGSIEQKKLYKNTLKQQAQYFAAFFKDIVVDYQQKLDKALSPP